MARDGDPAACLVLGVRSRRWLARNFALLLVLSLPLAACGGQSTPNSEDPEADETPGRGTGGTTGQGGTNVGGTNGTGASPSTGGRPRCDGLLVSPSPVCDFGVPCDDARDCGYGDCYLPGTRRDAVCSKHCSSDDDCPLGSACVEVGGEGSHCFVECASSDVCRAINDAPENPLTCVEFENASVCIQASEP